MKDNLEPYKKSEGPLQKDRSWMYGSIESLEFIDSVLEFCGIAVEHQVRTRGVDFYYPCVKFEMYQSSIVLISLGSTYFNVGLSLNNMFGFGMVTREFTKKKLLLRMPIMWMLMSM